MEPVTLTESCIRESSVCSFNDLTGFVIHMIRFYVNTSEATRMDNFLVRIEGRCTNETRSQAQAKLPTKNEKYKVSIARMFILLGYYYYHQTENCTISQARGFLNFQIFGVLAHSLHPITDLLLHF